MSVGELWSKLESVAGPILTYLSAAILAVGGFGAIIYWLFKLLAEKWLNAKFEERLSAYKHAQQKELEQLKFEISALLDRTVKLHQREFDVLPEAWGLLTDAFSITRPVTLGAVFSPDIKKMTGEQFEDFLEKIPLAAWQKSELKAASDPVRYYLDAISWHDLNRAQKSCAEFHVYLLKNGIFIPPDIRTKFSELDDLLAEAIGERRAGLQYPTTGMAQTFDKGVALDRRGPGLLKSLERDVQGRLWNLPVSEP
jgi:hypothetical protein